MSAQGHIFASLLGLPLASLRRTASFDVLSVKIGLTESPVGEFKHQKSVVNFEQEGCIFHLYGGQKPLGGISQNFFGVRRPRGNHVV